MSRAVYAVMGTVLFGAIVIMVAGFEALLLDRDPIDEPDAGTLLGPLMVAAAVLVVLLSLLRSAPLSDARDDRAPEVRGTFPAQPLPDARPARPGPRPGDEGGGVPRGRVADADRAAEHRDTFPSRRPATRIDTGCSRRSARRCPETSRT